MSERLAFDPEVLAFCKALSEAYRHYDGPEREAIVALAYWLRESNLRQLARRYPDSRRGLGRVFHVPPSNVPTLILYAWITSLLAGNRNIVRLSDRQTSSLESALMAPVEVLLSSTTFRGLAGENRFVRYGHDDAQSNAWIRECQSLVVWGSDRTQAHFQALAQGRPVLAFPPRHSLMMVDLERCAPNSEAAAVGALSERLWRDTAAFDQQACSSPRGILWRGKGDRLAAWREQLWDQFNARLQKRDGHSDTALAASVEREVHSQRLWAAGWVTGGWRRSHCGGVEVAEISPAFLSDHPGGFLFVEAVVPPEVTWSSVLSAPLQTLTCWPPESLADLPKTPNIIRRIPAGTALDFDVLWDGRDLIAELSRCVDDEETVW